MSTKAKPKRKKKAQGIFQYASDDNFDALTEYAESHGWSFLTALRHEALRRVLRDSGGLIPAPEVLAEKISLRGIPCTAGRIVEDLRMLGWEQ